MITSKGCPPDLSNNVKMISGETLPLSQTVDQRKGKERIVDLHPRETSMSRTHVYHLYCLDSRYWCHPKISASISGGRREMVGRVSLIDEEILEIAVQRVFVSSQDEVGCLGS